MSQQPRRQAASSPSREVMVLLHLALLQPHREHCRQFEKHVNVLECVWRRGKKLVKLMKEGARTLWGWSRAAAGEVKNGH